MGKPTILYVGNPIRFSRERWAELEKRCNVLYYSKLPLSELIEAFSEGGKYSTVDGILRPNNTLTNNLPLFNKELIPHLPPSLKIIASVNHGYDGQDTEELARHKIWYCNGAGAANDSTADLALFLIIATFRRTSFCEHKVRSLRRGNYYDIEDEVAEIAHNPHGKVLGIVGLGEIGQAVATRALALGMKIHYFGRSKKTSAVESKLGGAVYHSELKGLLEVTDCLLLACPHTPETHHLLNSETFKLMKRGVRVINVGRGKCVDEEALADAIDEGIVSSAGLDVYQDEPKINARLLDNWHVTLLPHVGGATIDTQANFEQIAMGNIEAFFFGDGKPLTPVNKVEDYKPSTERL
ncbi:D-mandelate dehydrogenase [Arthroderma uncinatum]|uniref:D-mandelate dehydrogenase n=1 Tax=Arthroderma uncinatum TaxID=74035 RepID=UPI00144A9999|nr:D-mandelate dehydrogenase [Arthroderma uncinatum]XP_033403951.1 D-mandelate dehydrogenase [Arthroderma uncinatum]KAF3479405.1 D-mandelate dehydrogenase [Arthroderma uncinatum]KAF3480043.1 D-mandelate dehydrogenase [Arthroderma uncinatum]